MLRYVLVAASALQATADTTACAAALADMANPQSANVAKHSLAAFTSANVAAAGGAFAGWPTGETYGFLLAQHMSDFGDPDACEAIGGYRFFGVQYAFGQMGLCLPRVCDVEDLNDFRAVLPLAPSKIVSGRFRFRLGVGGGLMIALALLLVMMALVARTQRVKRTTSYYTTRSTRARRGSGASLWSKTTTRGWAIAPAMLSAAWTACASSRCSW